MYQKLLISGVLIVVCPLLAEAVGPQEEQATDSPLRQFDWLIGEWEHVNDDSYNRVEQLVFKWSKDRNSIEASYRYTLNPGFCETGFFRCSETIRTSPDGNLEGSFDYMHLEGWGSSIRGKYALSRNASKRWEGKSTRDGGKKKETSELMFRKLSDTSFEFVTSAAWSKGSRYSYRFTKKPKT